MSSRNEDTYCRYCGRQVTWCVSKAGKRYLAEQVNITGEEGFRIIKIIYPAHRCRVSVDDKKRIDAEIARQHQDAVDRGEIVKGQIVKVSKGRKYPIGTTGYIDWVARDADQFGVLKVRMVLASGEKIYINRENVEAVQKCAAS